jgi:hypothetical protein
VDEVGDPWPRAKRGRRLVHSPRKMAVICVLMLALGLSYRSMEALLYMLKLPWLKPVPDHSTIHEAFGRIPEAYLDQPISQPATSTLHQTTK